MGRSSAKEQSNETTTYQEPTPVNNSFYQYQSETPVSTSRGAVTDSESMARDIKEGRLSGYVGNGTTLTGETSFQAMLRVDGHLTGRVTSENGTLIVGSNGRVDANIAVASAVVNGVVNGDIVASEKLEFGRTARVVGNIQTPRLVMEDGAILEGGCTMIKARETSEKRSSQGGSNNYANGVAETVDESVFAETEETEEAAAS